MAQSIEITEEINNGKTHPSPITKSINTFYVKATQSNGAKCEIELKGRSTQDYRIVSESNSAVFALAVAAPTTDINTLFAAPVKQFPGGLELETFVDRNFSMVSVVEFYDNPQDAGVSTVIVEAEEKNTAERAVYIVEETYTNIKAKWVL